MDTDLIARVLELAIALQQIPAPTFAEAQRAAFLYDRFLDEGLSHTEIDKTGNVYACLTSAGFAPPVVVSAHMDTVFPASTDLQVFRNLQKISAPGISDNAVGLASLFGLLWALRQAKDAPQLPGDLWLAANVGEEGLGNLRGMRAAVDRFGDRPLAYIVLEGLLLGQVYHRGLGVRRYRITVRTAGGHSWVDYGNPSAIHELAALVTRLTALPLPNDPRTSLNVGVIEGGMTVNTIAAEAHLQLDLRSEDPHALNGLIEQVETLVQEANCSQVTTTAEVIGHRPAGEIPPQHPLVRLAMRSLEAVGIQPRLSIGSTDANEPLSRGLPAICIGLTTGSGAHTLHETANIQPLAQGLDQLLALVRGCYRLPGASPAAP